MDEQPATPMDASNVVPLRVAGELPLPLGELVEQAFRIAVGLVAISAEALTDAVTQTLGGPGARGGDAEATGDRSATLPLLAGATMGAAVGVARWSARAATTLVRTGEIVFSPITHSGPFRDGMLRVGSELDALDSRWREERLREEAAAESFIRLLVPQVVDAALDQVDVNEIVAERVNVGAIVERVDLDTVVASVDLNAIIERVDVDRVLDRVDLPAIVDRLPLDHVIARIDLDDIVARVDLDAVASRLDVGAVVRRLDLAAIAQEVVDELDLPEIIRESMGSMTTETVGGIRVQSMNADRAISRLVDRVLQRGTPSLEETDDLPEDPT